MSDTSERIWAWENWHRDGQKSGQWCNYTKNGTEYIRADLHEAERARADKAEAALKATLDRETAMIARHDARVAKLEAERDALAVKLATARNDALEEAAQVAERCDVYSSAALRQRIASAIRAMKGAKP